MNYVLIIEATHDMYYRVDLTYMRQEFVSESLTLRRALHKSRNIDELDHRRRVLLGMVHIRKYVKPLIRNGNNADIRFYRAEGIVRRFGTRIGEGIEKRALAHIRKSYYTELHKNTFAFLTEGILLFYNATIIYLLKAFGKRKINI